MTFGREPHSAVAATAQLAALGDQQGHFFERHSADTAGLRHERLMSTHQDPEAAETAQIKDSPAVDLPRLVRLCADHGYETSRDYDALYDAAQRKAVVCFVDYHECRDVACTLVRRNSFGTETEIGARGLTYIGGISREAFAMQCRRYNVEFILPNDQADTCHE